MIYIHHILQLEMLLHSQEVLSNYTNKKRSHVISLSAFWSTDCFRTIRKLFIQGECGFVTHLNTSKPTSSR
jgi:hypothetical protein